MIGKARTLGCAGLTRVHFGKILSHLLRWVGIPDYAQLIVRVLERVCCEAWIYWLRFICAATNL